MPKKNKKSELIDLSAAGKEMKLPVVKDGKGNVTLTLPENSLPGVIAQIEDVANATMATSQEVLLAVEYILASKFGFADKKEKGVIQNTLEEFEKELEKMIALTRTFERENFSVLSPKTMQQIGELAQIRKVKELIARNKLNVSAEELQKALPKSNKGLLSLKAPKK